MTAAALACAACGAEVRENNKFCYECGSRITVSPNPAEYKQVTVLFADVVRSMDIAAAVDMERVREIMTELVERSAAVVQRYGGTVEYNGDGVMAILAPQLHWRITLFGHVSPRWRSSRRPTGWRPRWHAATV
jgi:DNA-directed RNA polymerase subunit RPC12/RpoP